MKIGKKLLSLLLALTLLTGLCSCFEQPQDNTDDDGASKGDTPKLSYELLLDSYHTMLLARKNGETVTPAEDNAVEKVLAAVVAKASEPGGMGYAMRDLDHDEQDELILLDQDRFVYAVFTEKDGVACPVLSCLNEDRIAILSDGRIFYMKGKATDSLRYVALERLIDGTLRGTLVGCEMTGEGDNAEYKHYQIENGVRTEITYDGWYQKQEGMLSEIGNTESETRDAGLYFISMLPEGESTAPKADFPDYESILSVYREIVPLFADYTRAKWYSGEYDSLYTFSDRRSYEIFHTMFRGIAGSISILTPFPENGENAYGYAMRDLDGDGTNELLLMNDEYDVFALYTMRDGKPVALSLGLYSFMINAQGRVTFARNHPYYYRDAECFLYEVKNGRLSLVCGVGYHTDLYLEKFGWYQIAANGSHTEITAEQGEALYAMCKRDAQMSSEEFTRNVSGLVFTPLFEKPLASEAHLATFSNRSFINGDTVTISAIEDNGVSFELYLVVVLNDDIENWETYSLTVSGEAVFKDGVYIFSTDGLSGYLEFGADIVWAVITESENTYITPTAKLFNRKK